MIQQYAPLILADPRWFDVAWAPGTPLLRTRLEAGRLGPDWRERIEGPWTIHAPCGTALPSQGWKVHVAALPSDADDIVRVTARACAAAGVPFKHLRSAELVHASQMKYAERSASGKVVTCYPDVDRLEEFAVGLASTLGERPAPEIVGEVQVGSSPVWLRYGAFLGRHRLTADGRVIPVLEDAGRMVADRRGVHGMGPEPAFVTGLRRARADRIERLDISHVRLLHRSNAGGVYRATWQGRRVIIKEARRHAGLDFAGNDAIARLRHEHRVLIRLDGSRTAPEPYAYLEREMSEFLVMEDLGRPPIMSVLSSTHPAISRDVGAAGVAAYRQWRDTVLVRLEALIDVWESRGVVHGDLQPSNLVALDDRLVGMDFESAVLDGERLAVGVATPGFGYEKQVGDRLSDAPAVVGLSAVLSYPAAATLLPQRPELAKDLIAAGEDALDALVHGGAPSVCRAVEPPMASLVAGIAAAANPQRADRLFPGDREQSAHPTGALGIVHGAAGVLAALAATGHAVDPRHLDWLADAAVQCATPVRGLSDGLDGVALTLARLGRPDAAVQVLERAQRAGPFAEGPGLGAGLAAEAVSTHALAELLCDDRLRRRADRAWAALARCVHDNAPCAGEGLFGGWAGAGLALLYSGIPNAAGLARAALGRGEASLAGTDDGALFARTGRTLWPYLGRGSAGLGILAHALTDHAGADGESDRRLAEIVAGVAETCRVAAVYDVGLLDGRAGLLLTLRTLTADSDPWIDIHRRRLGWHCLPTRGRADAVDVLGRHGLRASTDVGTGASGVLLAMSQRPWRAFAQVLGLDLIHVTPKR